MLDLSPTNVGVTEPGLSPTGVGVIDLQDGGADMGFWQLLLLSAFGLSLTDVSVTDPRI